MNGTTKNVLFLLLGIATGSGAAFCITKKIYKKKYSDFAEKQIQQMEEYYGVTDNYRREVNVLDDFDDEEVNPVTNTGRESGSMKKEDRDSVREFIKTNRDVKKTDYRHIYPDPADLESPPEDKEEEEIPMNAAIEEHESNLGRLPRIISAEDASELPDYIDQETLLYYMYDDTLCNEDGEVFDRPEDVLGDCLLKYGFIDNVNDETRIFVMNYDLDTCYCVQKEFKSYEDDFDE